MSSKRLKLTLVKSTAGRLESHKATIRGLGIKKVRHSVEVTATPEVSGMINKVSYMLRVEEV